MLSGFIPSLRIPSEGSKEGQGIMYPLWTIESQDGSQIPMVCWGGGNKLCVRNVVNRTATFNPANPPWLGICRLEKGENPEQVLEEVKRTPLYAQLLELEKQGHFDAVFKKE